MGNETYLKMFNKGKPSWIKRDTYYDILVSCNHYEDFMRTPFCRVVGDRVKGFKRVCSFLEKFPENRDKPYFIHIEGHLEKYHKNRIEELLVSKGIDCVRTHRVKI